MRLTKKSIQERIAKGNHPFPSNFSNYLFWDGRTIVYHSETEPHDHKKDTEDATWKVQFWYFKKDYCFIYFRDGVKHVVTPNKGQIFEFDCLERHAVIKKSHADKFELEDYWRGLYPNDGEITGELACAFEFL